MLKKWGLLSTLLTLSAGSMFASQAPCPGQWELSAEFLYLMPTFDDTYFVLDSPVVSTLPNGTRENNNFDFKPGFRVGAAYGLCGNREIQISYTRVRGTQNKTVSGDNLFAIVGRPDFASAFDPYAGTASSSLNFLYESLEANFVQQTYNCNGLNLSFKGGIEAAYLKFGETYNFAITGGSSGNVFQTSRTWGVGPQIGIGVDYEILRSTCGRPSVLSFVADTSGSLLTGTTKTNEANEFPLGTNLLSTNNENAWRVIPAVHAKIGFNYDIALCGYDTSFGIGYEFDSYFRGLSRVIYPDDVADGFSTNSYYNYDVQGLYVSGTVRF